MARKPFVIHGKTYNSMDELAAELGTTRALIYNRTRRNNMTPEEVYDDFLKNKGKTKQYIVDGLSFSSKTAVYEHFHVSQKVVFEIARRENLSFSEAVLKAREYGDKIKGFVYTVDGKQFRTKIEVAKHLGISTYWLSELMRRYNDNFDKIVEHLKVNKEIRDREFAKYVIHGKSYTSIADVAEELGVTIGTLSLRAKQLGSMEAAYDFYVKKNNKVYVIRGKKFKSKLDIYSHYKISDGIVNYWINAEKLTFEEAVEFVLRGLNKKKNFYLDDKFFTNVADMTYYHLNVTVKKFLRYIIDEDKTVEEAYWHFVRERCVY